MGPPLSSVIECSLVTELHCMSPAHSLSADRFYPPAMKAYSVSIQPFSDPKFPCDKRTYPVYLPYTLAWKGFSSWPKPSHRCFCFVHPTVHQLLLSLSFAFLKEAVFRDCHFSKSRLTNHSRSMISCLSLALRAFPLSSPSDLEASRWNTQAKQHACANNSTSLVNMHGIQLVELFYLRVPLALNWLRLKVGRSSLTSSSTKEPQMANRVYFGGKEDIFLWLLKTFHSLLKQTGLLLGY